MRNHFLTFYMLFDCLKTFIADHVLNTAGILRRCFGVDPKGNQPVGKQGVTFINPLGNGPSLFRQENQAVAVYLDTIVFPEVFHCDADTGLAEFQFLRCLLYTSRCV